MDLRRPSVTPPPTQTPVNSQSVFSAQSAGSMPTGVAAGSIRFVRWSRCRPNASPALSGSRPRPGLVPKSRNPDGRGFVQWPGVRPDGPGVFPKSRSPEVPKHRNPEGRQVRGPYPAVRSRREFRTTNTDENAMAAAAIIGFKSPMTASGTANTL